MSKTSAILKGSSVLLLSLAYGCTSTAPNSTQSVASGAQLSGSSLISNNAGGLISNNAGGLISNNAGGLISNNAGGLISNNAGGLISNNAGGLISNNAGGLAGSVKGPSAGLISNNAGGLISNNAGGLISNNAGGLISNNAGGLISNNAGGYHTLATVDGNVSVPNAKVGLFNERGEMLSYAWSVTDKNGNYSFPRVKPSSSLIFVKVVYQIGNQQMSLMACAPAPREAGKVNSVEVTPATTIVAKKILEMVRLRVVSVAAVKPEAAQAIATKVAPLMSDKAVFLATTLASNEAAKTFDNFCSDPKAPANLRNTLAAEMPSAPSVVGITPDQAAADPNANPTLTGKGSIVTSGNNGGNAGGGTTPANNGGSTTPANNGGTTTPTPTPTPDALTAVVSSIEGLSLTSAVGLNANGNDIYFPNGGSGSFKLTASSATQVTKADLSASGAKAYSFSAGQAYVLTGNSIARADGTGAVTLTGMAASGAADFVVVGNFAYVTSDSANSIYKVSLSTGAATLFAGDGNTSGKQDGTGTAARFANPKGITYVASANALFVADSGNYRIRKVDLTSAAVTSFAGNDTTASIDGKGAAASFRKPYDVTADTAGNLYVVDLGSNNIRKITTAGDVTLISGNGTLTTKDGTGSDASFEFPTSIAFGKAGNNDVLYVGQPGAVRVVQGW